jgi:hypothetical protein
MHTNNSNGSRFTPIPRTTCAARNQEMMPHIAVLEKLERREDLGRTVLYPPGAPDTAIAEGNEYLPSATLAAARMYI